MDRTLSGATTPGQSGPENDGNEEVLRILQSSSITGASPSDCLLSYLGDTLVRSYPSAENVVRVFYSVPLKLVSQTTTIDLLILMACQVA